MPCLRFRPCPLALLIGAGLGCLPPAITTERGAGLSVFVTTDSVGRPIEASLHATAVALEGDQQVVVFSIEDIEPTPLPDELMARVADRPTGACATCTWVTTRSPMLLLPGDSCPIPRDAGARGDTKFDSPELRSHVFLERFGACADVREPMPFPGELRWLYPEREADLMELVSVRPSDGAILLASERVSFEISPSGERRTIAPFMKGPGLAAAALESSFVVLSRSSASEVVLHQLMDDQVTLVDLSVLARLSPRTVFGLPGDRVLVSGRTRSAGGSPPFWALCSVSLGRLSCEWIHDNPPGLAGQEPTKSALLRANGELVGLGSRGTILSFSAEGVRARVEETSMTHALDEPVFFVERRGVLYHLAKNDPTARNSNMDATMVLVRTELDGPGAGQSEIDLGPGFQAGLFEHDGRLYAALIDRIFELDDSGAAVAATRSSTGAGGLSVQAGLRRVVPRAESVVMEDSEGRVWSGVPFSAPLGLIYGPPDPEPAHAIGIDEAENGTVVFSWSKPLSRSTWDLVAAEPTPKAELHAPVGVQVRAGAGSDPAFFAGSRDGAGFLGVLEGDELVPLEVDSEIPPINDLATSGKHFVAVGEEWVVVVGDGGGARRVQVDWDDPATREEETAPSAPLTCEPRFDGFPTPSGFADVDAWGRFAVAVGCDATVIRVDLELGRAQRVALPPEVAIRRTDLGQPFSAVEVVGPSAALIAARSRIVDSLGNPFVAEIFASNGPHVRSLSWPPLDPLGFETSTPLALVGSKDEMIVFSGNHLFAPLRGHVQSPASGRSEQLSLPVGRAIRHSSGTLIAAGLFGRVLVGR